MSLLDFDDDGGTNVQSSNASFGSHAFPIDDPFGFNAFGTGSAGDKSAASAFSGNANSSNFFDDFDPLTTFDDDSGTNHQGNQVRQEFTTTEVSFNSQPNTDDFDMFGGFPRRDVEVTSVTTTTTTITSHPWNNESESMDSSSKNLNFVADDDFHSPQQEKSFENAESSGVVKDPFAFSEDPFWSFGAQNHNLNEQDVATQPHSNTDAMDFILSDFNEETAPKAEMEDLSPVKTIERTATEIDNSREINYDDRKDSMLILDSEANVTMTFGDSHESESIGKASEPIVTNHVSADVENNTVGSLAMNGRNDFDSGSSVGWAVTYNSTTVSSYSPATEKRDESETLYSSSNAEEMNPKEFKSGKEDSQTLPATIREWNFQEDIPARQTSSLYEKQVDSKEDKAVPSSLNIKTYSFQSNSDWKRKEMEDVEQPGYYGNQFSANKHVEEEAEREANAYHDEEDDAVLNHFTNDFNKDRSRGRMGLEEIRQRSYEDIGPMTHSSHKQNRNDVKTSSGTDKAPTVYVLGAASDNICKICSKRVYEMEKITADLQVFHKTCFRCNHCNRILSLGNFSANDGRLYCKPHFIEIFKTKGNYKDSFALAEQHKHQPEDFIRNEMNEEDESDYHHQTRNSSNARNRHSSGGSSGNGRFGGDTDSDTDAFRHSDTKEEIPVVQIKSVRSMFEKLSTQDPSAEVGSQKQKQTKPSGPAQTEAKRQTQVHASERASSDSEKSDVDRDGHRFAERKDSASGAEIVQSGTVCIIEEELPPPSNTRSVLAKFKMMEKETGGAVAPAVNAKPAPAKQTPTYAQSQQSYSSHQTPAKSRESHDVRPTHDDLDSAAATHQEEERGDELPQAGLAKSLLAQWRNLEEQSKRGRNRDLKPASSARRSQSMSRVETLQRARLYPKEKESSGNRYREEDDIKRMQSLSDEETSGDDLPIVPTRQRLAKFQQMEGRSQNEVENHAKPRRTFKWEVKEATFNRGGLVVHGDVPKRSNAVAPTEETSNTSDGMPYENQRASTSSTNDANDKRTKRWSSGSDDETSREGRDIVTVVSEEELPPRDTTRNLLQQFKQMEDLTKAPPRPGLPPARSSGESKPKAAAVIREDSNNERRLSYEQSYRAAMKEEDESGEFENESAERDPNVLRESDHNDEMEMPVHGTTKNLMAKFQSLQTKH